MIYDFFLINFGLFNENFKIYTKYANNNRDNLSIIEQNNRIIVLWVTLYTKDFYVNNFHSNIAFILFFTFSFNFFCNFNGLFTSNAITSCRSIFFFDVKTIDTALVYLLLKKNSIFYA